MGPLLQIPTDEDYLTHLSSRIRCLSSTEDSSHFTGKRQGRACPSQKYSLGLLPSSWHPQQHVESSYCVATKRKASALYVHWTYFYLFQKSAAGRTMLELSGAAKDLKEGEERGKCVGVRITIEAEFSQTPRESELVPHKMDFMHEILPKGWMSCLYLA